MKITIKSSTLVKPAKETPKCVHWNSNIDLVIPRIHIPTVYFYKPKCNEGQVFDCGHLKDALGRALVPFYPMAGRLKDKGRGRIDINCNGEGVLFVEANADGCISQYGENFAPCMKMRRLIPQIDHSKDSSSFPLLVIQVTFFKCGGVAIGTGVHHHVTDGLGALWFLNYWADIARGIEKDANPFFDRTLLSSRNPPEPKFTHVEYQPPPLLLNAEHESCRKCCGNVGMSKEHAILSDDLISQNGDHVVANGGSIKASDNYHKVNSNNNELTNHAGANGDYRIEKVGSADCMIKIVDHIQEQGGVKLVNGDGKNVNVNCPYSPANVDHSGQQEAVRLDGADVGRPSFGAHVISENGSHVKNHDPFPKSLCNEEDYVQPSQTDEKWSAKVEDTPKEEYYGPISAELFIFSRQQVESLKARAAEHAVPDDRPFSGYEVLAGHIWRCACLARGLQDAQVTKLYIATDGRNRLQPLLPAEYFGNVIFTAAPVVQVGQLVGGPLATAARHIRETVQIMDDEYLRSALDFLELQPNLAEFSRGAHTFKTPNLGITSWLRLPIYGADFGWGPPLSMAPAGVPFEGLAYLLPGPPGDDRVRLSITLSPDHMLRFQDLVYQI